MNPSTALASVFVDELVRNDVRHIVVCPGSRNAPLSMALDRAARDGRLNLHVRIDERSAGFLALGLARALAHRGPGLAAVVCTSGTAVANLHPAVLEAHHSNIGLLLLTADRPAELHGTGASQTIEQRGLFGPAAASMEFPVAHKENGQNGVWRGLVCRAVALARAGEPVQVNLPFREPLVPDADASWPESLDGRPDGAPWTQSTLVSASATLISDPDGVSTPVGVSSLKAPRTAMIVGDDHGGRVRAAAEIAARAGWPVIAEPTVAPIALAAGAAVLGSGSLLLGLSPLPAELAPDAVVVVGRPTLSRAVARLLRTVPVVQLVGPYPRWPDPQHLATHVSDRLAPEVPAGFAVDPAWLAGWLRADEAAGTAVDKLLAEAPRLTGLQVARELVDALPVGAPLFLGSSNPVRAVDLVARPRADLLVLANRGVAGIDGSVSTAAGLALGLGEPTYALLGDLTFLHDINGLLTGPAEPRPDLTIVVCNDNGGGIFALLEQGAPEHAASFERVFGTPHDADLAALCAGYRASHTLVDSLIDGVAGLRAALAPAPGVRVIEVRMPRDDLRDLYARLRATVAAAVTSTLS
ncbi:MAG TPA: 2-succinyl-5-enolpyruvyl-6-hydroxy-3-cyclohexene-1-carboxylic-acid synthase [Pseudonocardiaceae bacterium]|jgi:2-succinyl-5-enolpyruvyl-6-hydroxy-3-cyclohexene-1-carboxylate synthase|nr:2-succinyl-5-enolpyruvyl-6-hydroxy-3-cyclohexene-1-carboxylic-acid synthase [Pseudonocardiaceae bacterium]